MASIIFPVNLTVPISLFNRSEQKLLALNSLERAFTQFEDFLNKTHSNEARNIHEELTQFKDLASRLWFSASSAVLALEFNEIEGKEKNE